MKLGYLIGAAIAGKVITDVVKTVSTTKNDQTVNTVQAPARIYVQPVQVQDTRTNNKANDDKSDLIRYCEYCDCIYYLGRVSVCPHCGAPIRRQTVTQKQNVQSKPKPKLQSGYYVDCYNCGKTIRYAKEDIYRSPVANRAVQAKGFTGHTGEVKCPNCGVFLPHYESNYKEY